MLDIKEIRKNLEYFKKQLLYRYNILDLDQIIVLDKENRKLINKKLETLPVSRFIFQN